MLLLRAEVVGPVNLVVVRLNSNRLPMEVLVKPYNPSWAVAFDSASALVMNAMGFNAIEACHIGSTAIPNIWAKPIIDMMITVTNIDTVDTCNRGPKPWTLSEDETFSSKNILIVTFTW